MSRREFHFQEGTSSKFWAIDVQGASFTVQYGRLGTAGQTQTKDFGSDTEAQKNADRLIAEKTKKGYVEIGSTAAAVAPAAASPLKAKPKLTPPASTAAVAAPSAPALVITRRIDLSPQDWFWALGRPRQPLPRPASPPAAFDADKAIKHLVSVVTVEANGWWDWRKIRVSSPPSSAEAHFWLEAMAQSHSGIRSPEKLAAKLSKQSFDGQLTYAAAVDLLKQIPLHLSDKMRIVFDILPSLLTPAELVTLIIDNAIPDPVERFRSALVTNLLQNIIPHLTSVEVEKLKPILRPHVTMRDWPTDASNSPPSVFVLAGALGMREELTPIVESWPNDHFQNVSWVRWPQLVAFGLADARQVDRHIRRVKLAIQQPDLARAWVANTEFTGLDYLRDAILRITNKNDAEKLFEVFKLVQAPEAAPHVLALRLNSKVAGLAGVWLDENPGNAIAGLIPIVAGKDKLAEAAIEFLRAAKKRGYADFIAEQLKIVPVDVAAKVRELVLEQEEKVYEPLDAATTPKPLRNAFAASTAATRLPAWAAPELLAPILVGGRRLLDVQVSAVLAALRQTPPGSPEPLLDALRQHGDRSSLDAFAWSLFEKWLADGAPAKEKWALLAIGHLGGDASVLKLTPLVRAWPGESQHARAVLGLECLRAVGSDAALMQLNGIAQKLKFQGLKNKAKEFMEAIASDKGLTREELEDRIVPDLDLDERGSRVLDFGSRQFGVVLGPDLTPLVRDEAGKVKADLPKPGAKDDAEKATAAVADWKVLKKLLREVLKVQVPRLEQAMVTGRRWTPEQFETLLVRHPLMSHLTSRLVWGGYDDHGKLCATFRVTEEREYADAKEKPFALKGLATVGIVHPLHLTKEQLAAWGEVFGDYEIITPFPQLGRPVLALEPSEAKGKTLTRLAKAKLPQQSTRGTLERLSWVRGSASDHGVVTEFIKQFPSAGVTALLEIEPGIALGLPDWIQDQSVPRVFFLKGLYSATDYPYHKEEKMVPLNKVDEVTVSEVLADLNVLAEKAT